MNQVLFQRQFVLNYENISAMRRILDDKAQALQLAPDTIQSIKLVCSEYCANLLDHQQQPATHCTISYGRHNGQYCFSISDNGSPWPAQAIQINQAELPDFPDESGMGLALIKTTFPNFSYTINPDNNKIEFLLPLQSTRKHLVIVDDSRSQLTMLSSYLEADYQLSIFSRAGDAFKWLQGNHCDLVLTDLWMPDTNGLEFRGLVGELRRHRLLPFVFLSGDTVSETMAAVTQSGIDDFLAKPIEKHHLLQVLERVLNRHHHLLNAFEDNLLQQLETTTPLYQGDRRYQAYPLGNFNMQISREPEISGDFVIQHSLENGSQLLILGDLMGHGIVAKANGGICYGLIQGLLLDPTINPETIFTRLNDHLYRTEANRLICLLGVHLDQDQKLSIYNAGMPAPLSFTPSCHRLREGMGLIGLFDCISPVPQKLTLSQGDSLHCFSDGLLESELPETVQQHIAALPAEQRHHYLWQRQPDNHEDDRTLISLTPTTDDG